MKAVPRSLVGQDVSRDPDAVRAMFGRIARRYDLANHVLSGGADFLWRRRAAKIVEVWQPRRVLDLATGSGDLALAIQRRLPQATIVAADFSPEMLQIARSKGVRETVLADALQLPFADHLFDCVTVA
ncbi:MAG TPA: class I SAM-dependent methyltransferase, partial [Chthoniobacterales bacterium]